VCISDACEASQSPKASVGERCCFLLGIGLQHHSCDNVDKVEGRLESVESGFAQLNIAISQILAQTNGSRTSSIVPLSPPDTATNAYSEDEQPEDASHDESMGHHIFRDPGEMIDYFHGSSSIFVLCNQLKALMMEKNEADPQILQILAEVCRTAGEIETLPIAYEQAAVRLPMKQQSLSAVEHFLRHVDFSTDIFVPENLLENLERIYSEPLKPQDEAWATCFHAIIILVLGRETALPASNALLTGFARNLLPSRAALVNQRLLTSPRLINIQALLLLVNLPYATMVLSVEALTPQQSIAAQQYDPPGWAEMIFVRTTTRFISRVWDRADWPPPPLVSRLYTRKNHRSPIHKAVSLSAGRVR